MARVIISATSNATVSSAIEIGFDTTGSNSRAPLAITRPATFIAFGLGTAETVDIQISNDGGTTWEDYYHNGSLQQLTGATSTKTNALTIVGPGFFRADKSSTSTAIQVVLSTQDNP